MSNQTRFHYTSNEEVLPYIAQNRFRMTLSEITNACAWALDPACAERAAIFFFVGSLPQIDRKSLGPEPEDQDCSICLSGYGTVSRTDTPTQMPCGHIMGAECIEKWLKVSETCPQCRRRVFTRPVEPGHLMSKERETLLREILNAGRDFLTENFWEVDESYDALCAWAQGVGQHEESVVSRLRALDCIAKLERFAASIWKHVFAGLTSYWVTWSSHTGEVKNWRGEEEVYLNALLLLWFNLHVRAF